jgi:hypothetical protein
MTKQISFSERTSSRSNPQMLASVVGVVVTLGTILTLVDHFKPWTVGASALLGGSSTSGGQSSPQATILKQADTAKTADIQTATVNGLTLRAGNFQAQNGYLTAEICFTMPSDADWSVGRPTLQLGDGTAVQASTIYLMNVVSALNQTGLSRCDRVEFQIPANADLSAFTIEVHRLQTSVPEQPDCDKAQEKLNALKTGIIIQCSHGNGMFSFNIVQRPLSSSISDVEVSKTVYEAFMDTRPGSWIFTGRLNQ